MPLQDQIEFLETLGEGSFGVVCLARLTEGHLKRTVVLKILKEDWAEDERVLTRARDEARLLALLNHDNIVKVERLETVGKKTVVVMEYVQGLSLDLILGNLGPLPVRVALQTIGKVAGALDAAYNRTPTGEKRPLQVVHRDIKPSNIIVSISGTVKVLDFGTARGSWESREARTETDMGMGTLLYMAPECFDEGQPGPEVDIYALGSTLFELLSGVRLGRLSVDPARHDAQRLERVQQLNPAEIMGYPRAMEAVRAVVDRCIRYKRDERPNAAELRNLCRQALYVLPTQRPTLDLYAETCVEPLWQRRDQVPPPSVAGTLDISGEKPKPPAARPFLPTQHFQRPSGAPQRNLADAAIRPALASPGRGITPIQEDATVATPAPEPPPRTPPPKRPPSRTPRPPDTTFIEGEEESNRGIILIAFLGVLLGVGGIVGVGALMDDTAEVEATPAAEKTTRDWGRRRYKGAEVEAAELEAAELEAAEPEVTKEETPVETPRQDPPAETPAPSTRQSPPSGSTKAVERPAAPRPVTPTPSSGAAEVPVDVLLYPIRGVLIDGRSHMPGKKILLSVGGHSLRFEDSTTPSPCTFAIQESSTKVQVKPVDGQLVCTVL
ncbi:MAG: protein kinase [Alphaproteobacteria bacterium]|nr:protein kinase [Alphaproteobacteria bacterium]